MNALQELNSQQRVLASRRQQLSAQLAAEKQYVPSSSVASVPGAGQQPGSNELDSAILQAQTRLDQLLRVYTPKHPEVIALEESLSQMRAQRREELQKMGVTEMPERGGLVANPAYEQIRLQRNQVDVELAAVGGQIADRTARLNNMRSRMETMPEVEAQLAQLTRDYDVLKERYATMLQQLEAAKMSETVGESDAVDFSILDPPAALAAPVAPPRLLLLIGVLVLGLGAGAAVAFLLSKLNPVFDSPAALQTSDRAAGARGDQRHLARPAQAAEKARGDPDCDRDRGTADRVHRHSAGHGMREAVRSRHLLESRARP